MRFDLLIYILQDKLRFRNPSDPFSCEELLREKRCLPELSGPGLTLMRINNTSFILIFGGHSVDEDKAVSTLIAVDVDHLEWWYVRVEGGHVAARINPVVVAVEKKLYIFSGFKTFSKKQCHPFKSYSIATYSAPRGGWHWEARDVSYSGLDHQLFGAGLPVYDGKKILLTPGKLYYQEDCEARQISIVQAKHQQLTYFFFQRLAVGFFEKKVVLLPHGAPTIPGGASFWRFSERGVVVFDP